MHAEKRKIKRRHLIYYLQVIDREQEQVVGYMVDITTNGIMLMSEKAIEPGTVLPLKVLVQTDMTTKNYLDFDARCKWCRKSPNDISHDAGFELLNVSGTAFRDIEEIIEELGFKD